MTSPEQAPQWRGSHRLPETRSLENLALTWALINVCERCLKGGCLSLGFGCQRA